MTSAESDASPEATVTVFVLRRTRRQETELLLHRAAADAADVWSPVTAAVAAAEREADAAYRAVVTGTGLDPSRLYAAGPLALDPSAPRRGGVFVAFVDAAAEVSTDTPGDELAWQPLRSAGERLAHTRDRSDAERVHDRFVRRPPDEALRIL
jgi:ADP-ribose pyrophosphatase YjhB (NUDIX family)